MNQIEAPDFAIKEALQHKVDHKTKPLGALGQLEELAIQIGLIQQSLNPQIHKPTFFVFAGDHGIAKEGVSAYPQEVTFQMVMNFVSGGAAINVFCKQHGIVLNVVDSGVNYEFPKDLPIINCKVGMGTKSFLHQAAMTPELCEQAMVQGGDLVLQAKANGTNCIGFGEMGIANTSSASMLMHGITQLPLEQCVGRGTGLDDEQFQTKLTILKKAWQTHQLKSGDAFDVLHTFGGFEIAMMCGAMLIAAQQKMLILVDGFIATAAFLVAATMEPNCKHYAVFCHQSDESGHKNMLAYLDAKPLLNLGLRLGEGTGAALAFPLIQSALAFLSEMASFENAGVSNKES